MTSVSTAIKTWLYDNHRWKKPKLKTITSPESNQTGMQIKKFGALYFNCFCLIYDCPADDHPGESGFDCTSMIKTTETNKLWTAYNNLHTWMNITAIIIMIQINKEILRNNKKNSSVPFEI